MFKKGFYLQRNLPDIMTEMSWYAPLKAGSVLIKIYHRGESVHEKGNE